MLNFINYFKKNSEMKHTFFMGIFCTLLLEMGIFVQFLRDLDFKYIIFSLILLVYCFLLLFSVFLYDFIVVKHIEYILYTVSDKDTINSICTHFLPQCDVYTTWQLIKTKNDLCENLIHKGQKLLIPIDKK